MKVDVQYLEGPVLDYLVAQFNLDTVRKNFVIYQREPCLVTAWDPENVGHYDSLKEWKVWHALRYTTEWSRGGPIIDRLLGLGMEVGHDHEDTFHPIVCKLVAPDGKEYIGKGSTLLIAASKMLVLMTFGPEVEVPDELQ